MGLQRIVSRTAVGLFLTLSAAFVTPPHAAAQTVLVNGQQLSMNPGPIERAGRVFVPLRSIFERMGASVVYQNGTINATRERTTVSLTIGSTQATVNGQPQTLDVAPFIVGATTYVPLRFIAQSLGATVNYNNSTNVVSITHAGGGGGMQPMPPPPAPPPQMVHLQYQQPAPSAQITNGFPQIAAQFTRRVNPSSVRVWVDGIDVTSNSGITPSGINYRPSSALGNGMHNVRVAGSDSTGVRFDRTWSFVVIRSGPGMQLNINQPSNNQAVGWNFMVQGATVGNGKVNVTVGPSGSPTGLFAGSTTAGPQGNFHLNVTLRPFPGLQTMTMKVTVTNPNTSQIVQQTMQLRISQ